MPARNNATGQTKKNRTSIQMMLYPKFDAMMMRVIEQRIEEGIASFVRRLLRF
jgi:hypothetical protein